MRGVRRLLGGLGALLGLIGVVACLAGIVGCWYAYSDLRSRSERLFGEGEETLETARKDLVKVRDRMRRTQQQLDAVRQRETEFARRPGAGRVGGDAPEELTETRGLLVNATETAYVVDGLIDSLVDLPGGERFGLNDDELRRTSEKLSDLTTRLNRVAKRLERTAGPMSPDELENSERIAAALDRILSALDKAVSKTDEYLEQAKEWRARSQRILFWSAVGVTVLLLWIGLAQFSLMVHGWAWLRGRGAERV